MMDNTNSIIRLMIKHNVWPFSVTNERQRIIRDKFQAEVQHKPNCVYFDNPANNAGPCKCFGRAEMGSENKPKLGLSMEALRKEIRELKEEIFTTLRAYGTSRGHWCRYCEGHVIDGHKMSCPLIISAIERFGMDRVRKSIQVKEWDNYHIISEEARSRRKEII